MHDRFVTGFRFLALLSALLCGSAATAAELTVCADGTCPFRTIADASAAARDGDTIVLQPGAYHEPAVLTANRLTLRGLPGAYLAGGAIEDKAALVIKGDDVLIDGLDCSDIALPTGNGACIRMEGRNLTLRGVHFHDAQEGILAGDIGAPDKGVLRIEGSRLERLGFGGRAHAIYVGERDLTLHIIDSEILESMGEGHEIKSRGRRTIIENSVVASLNGLDSRLVDVPNGGELIIRGSLLQVGPYSQNPDMIGVGLERGNDPARDHVETSVVIEDNTILVQTGEPTRLTHIKHGPAPVVRHNILIGGAPDWGEGNRWYVDLAAAPPGVADRLPHSPTPRTLHAADALDDFVAQQLMRTVSSVWLKRTYPAYIYPGPEKRWLDLGPSGATSGYFPGALWLLWLTSGRDFWKNWAVEWTTRLSTRRNDAGAPDIGRVAVASFGLGYELTKDPRLRTALLAAARSLAARYNPAVGALRSWELSTWNFPVTVDTLMDVELLLRAAHLGNDRTLRDIAIAHGRRIMADHLRPDGGVIDLVDHDPNTGAVLSKHSRRGAAKGAVRARGQAHAIYGFATLYRATREPAFRTAAMKAADFYLANLPADGVPFRDFRAPADENMLRDSAAAAIAASGLLALAPQVSGPAADTYRHTAQRTLSRLVSADYLALDQLNGGLLRRGVASVPDGKEVAVTLMEGDYYFIEALDRARAAGLALDFAAPDMARTESSATPPPADEQPAAPATPAAAASVPPSALVFAANGSGVLWQGTPIALTPLELVVLRALVARAGEPVALADLQHTLRNAAPADRNDLNVKQTVLSLRRKFRAVDGFFHAIEFVPNGGFAWHDTVRR